MYVAGKKMSENAHVCFEVLIEKNLNFKAPIKRNFGLSFYCLI